MNYDDEGFLIEDPNDGAPRNKKLEDNSLSEAFTTPDTEVSMSAAKRELPTERLTFFRLNARVAKTYADCEWCHKVQTKGRDGFGGGQCDACLARVHDEIEAANARFGFN